MTRDTPRQDGVRDVPASITIAQWMLESGFGQHMPPHFNNPFGIKAARDRNFVMTPETTDCSRPWRHFGSFLQLMKRSTYTTRMLTGDTSGLQAGKNVSE
ncbi:glucosaminidase domain-containing protein [Komagataeibacter diospyri]|uniref:glucosaminidase domain-containing protein n=1 Tax=Komagataeibacter diospyri TaxID=1932662 RepID=UPI00350E4998